MTGRGRTTRARAYLLAVALAVSAPGLAALLAPSPALGLGSNDCFLTAAFHDLLGRAPSDAERATYLTALNGNSTRQQVAYQLDTGDEYRRNLAQSYYAAFLGRTATPGEVAPLLSFWQGGGTDEQVIAQILGANEYFSRAGGTNDAFLTAVYRDLLGRAPSNTERATFLTALNGNTTRQQVAGQIDTSGEYYADQVRSYYSKFLGRTASPGEVNAWVNQMQTGTRDEQVISALVGSDEYFAGHPCPTPTPTNTATPTSTTTAAPPATATPTPSRRAYLPVVSRS